MRDKAKRLSRQEILLLKGMDRAIRDYAMLDEGEDLAVAVSGGSDRLSLLSLLISYSKVRFGMKLRLHPVYLDLGYGNTGEDFLYHYIKEVWGFHLEIIRTEIGIRAHSDENRENPCFLCARLRKQVLFEYAKSRGSRKIALGHNRDDFLNTFFLNMIYAGELSTMKPCQVFFKGAMTIIRPLVYIDKSQTSRYILDSDLIPIINKCPEAGKSKRQRIENALEKVYDIEPYAKKAMLKSLQRPRFEYLMQEGLKRKP